MSKKTFIVIAIVCILLVTAFAIVLSIYLDVGINSFFYADGNMTYNGIFFTDGEKARIYRPLMRGFEDFEKKTFDLSPFGFDGVTFDYFLIDGIMYGDNEGIWPVSRNDKFVYIDEEDRKFVIDVDRNKTYPVFSGSQVELDEFGKNVVAFSSNGLYAVEMNGDEVTVYVMTADPGDFKVNEIRKTSLAEFGHDFRFGGFVSDFNAYFVSEKDGERKFAVLNMKSMTAVSSKLDPEAEYKDMVGRLFIENETKTEKGKIVLSWSNVLLGDVHYAYLDADEYKSCEITAVSQNGDYAAIKCETSSGEIKTVIAKNKKNFVLSEEKGKVGSVFFAEDNIIYVNFNSENGIHAEGMKICF